MKYQAFKASLDESQPPTDLPPLLRALWHDARGDWTRAHEIAQDIDSPEAAWVHAYLHREEGDPSNARYWYRRAGRPFPEGDLASEWDELARHLAEPS